MFDVQRPEVAIDDISTYSGAGGGAFLAAAAATKSTPAFAVGAPRPTPTHGAAEIDLTLGRATRVRADIYDLHGRLVRTAVDQELPPGGHVIRWNGRTSGGESAASGVYWMAIRAGEEERKIKLVVVR